MSTIDDLIAAEGAAAEDLIAAEGAAAEQQQLPEDATAERRNPGRSVMFSIRLNPDLTRATALSDPLGASAAVLGRRVRGRGRG
jgi:hypothetical protein